MLGGLLELSTAAHGAVCGLEEATSVGLKTCWLSSVVPVVFQSRHGWLLQIIHVEEIVL